MTHVAIKSLGLDDALALAPLIAEYAQAQRRGAPRRPDQYYAERILNDPTAKMIGAFDGERAIGFAIYFDLPEIITGLRIGQLDEIYVTPDERRKGIARKMIEALVNEGQSRGWLELRWIVPGRNEPAVTLYDKIAEPAGWKGYIIPIDRLALQQAGM
ncbi:GNAT family N-acetyltransferase [Rhizobiales bacterium]|uniref:GNAT family N-acetyltransferase n=1 Tax=Hongsoonwoonella zoysiae TaxID=2821844 RepID=UPI0015601C07|nr:GNAT family N-acetyltransferase [Hongsoonwoonella zoysiae]NRG16876.1 GNAT family N-acetyltransferase [Hongsoonwoonella zoysiae]